MSDSNTPFLDTATSEALTATQWSRRLRVSPSTVIRWALSERVEHVQVGREVRITPEAMEAFLKTRTESRLRRHRERTAGDTARKAAHSAEVDAELAKI